MFTGLSAFPLTPLVKGEIDENACVALIEALAAAGVNSIGARGPTGSYAYLTRAQRFAATRLAVSERLCGEISVPLCIYDNPATSGFEFNDELLVALSFLPNMGSIKLGDLPADPADALARVAKLKSQVAAGVTIGISGDAQSAAGLRAGCDVWYSVLAGLFPDYCLRLTQAALRGDVEETRRLNGALEPLWGFFRRYGSLRVIATVAELRGRAAAPCLPFPLQTLAGAERDALQEVAERVL